MSKECPTDMYDDKGVLTTQSHHISYLPLPDLTTSWSLPILTDVISETDLCLHREGRPGVFRVWSDEEYTLSSMRPDTRLTIISTHVTQCMCGV